MRDKTLLLIFSLMICATRLQGIELPAKTVQEQGRDQLLLCMAGEWIAHCLYVVAELDIADYLQEGSKTAEEIAAFVHADADSLHRVMRLLTSVGIFEEVQKGFFQNNETSLLLTKNHPFSLHDTIRYYGAIVHPVFDQLLASVKKGVPAFELKEKQPVFQYFKANPAKLALFQAAMREKSKAVIHSSIQNYDFSKLKTVYDIGGGYGHFVSALLKKYPQMQGVLYELPEVIAEAPQKNPAVLDKRLRLVSGNFFESVPSGGDAYLLKSVLHDWDDEHAATILRHCHAAMPDHGRLIIVEYVLMPKGEVYAKCMDVLMMAMLGGKERTLTAYATLLERTGFKINAVYPTSTEFSVIEAFKR